MKLEFQNTVDTLYPNWALYDDYIMIKGQKVLLSKIKEVKILKKQPDFFGPACIFLVDFNYNTHSLYVSNKDKNKWETAKNYILQNYGGKKLQERQQDLRNKAAMADAGMQVMMDISNIRNGGTSSYVSASQQRNETKEIIKGAVVGGIVAGDAGAVVGAIAAKNKIDNKKK